MIDYRPKLSLSVQSHQLTLAASPVLNFKTVKFELGIILLLGILLLLIHTRLFEQFIDSIY